MEQLESYGIVFEVDDQGERRPLSNHSVLNERFVAPPEMTLGIALSKLGTLNFEWLKFVDCRSVKSVSGRMTNLLLDELEAFTDLEYLNFYQTDVDPCILGKLKNLRALHSLGFENCNLDQIRHEGFELAPKITEMVIVSQALSVPAIAECEIQIKMSKVGEGPSFDLGILSPSISSLTVRLTTLKAPDTVYNAKNSVTRLELSLVQIDSQQLSAYLSPVLSKLELHNCVGMETFSASALNECINLEHLAIVRTKMFGQWPHVNLHNLRSLSLNGLNLVDDDVLWAVKCAQLQQIDLSGNKLSTATFNRLNEFKNLRELRLECLDLTEIPIINPESLTTLSLSGNLFEHTDVSNCSRYSQLQSLDLSHCKLEYLPPLDDCKNLSCLNLDGSPLEPSCFSKLRIFKSLRRLSLWNCEVDGEALESVLELAQLVDLNISNNNLETEALAGLHRFSELQALNLSENLDLAGDVITHLPHSLQSVNLSTTLLQDKDLSQLLAFDHLDFLDISDTAITDEGLAILAKHSSLRYLKIDGTKVSRNAITNLNKSKTLLTVSARRTNNG
jgi:hypothetical protein